MTPAPGVYLTTREGQPSGGVPTSVDVGFMVGVTEKGTLAPQLSTSFSEWQTKHGARNVNTQTAYDSAEFYFKSGGSRLYTSRVVGASAAIATIAVLDGAAATVFTANAKGPGAYGNDLNVVVRTNSQDAAIPVGSYRLRVQTDAAVVLEESPDLLDKAAGLVWAQSSSQYIDLVDGASANDPAAATYSLAGGNDDIAGINDARWLVALDQIPNTLGPGQVFAPGRTTSTGHGQLDAHALATNRIAVKDAADTAVVATLTAQPAASRSRVGGVFAPWVNVSGVTVGTVRKIPPSAIVAAKCAYNDGIGISPNQPAAGDYGKLGQVLSLAQPAWTAAERATLNAAGVNVIVNLYGDHMIFGWRTTAEPVTDSKWVNLGNSRLKMAVAAIAEKVGLQFVFRQIDGQGRLFSEFQGSLVGEACMPFFLLGSLYGDTPEQAFSVDVGPSVNTPATIAANELRAVITLRMSPYGETVTIELVKLLTTEAVS